VADAPARIALDPASRHAAVLTGGVCLAPLLLHLPPAIGVALAATAVAVAALAWRRPVPQIVRVLLAVTAIAAVLSLSGFRLGRDTGAALLAAMIAIKPAETFVLRDARSLVGFGLFAPFATFLLDQGPLALGLGLVAVLLALATLQRLADVESGDVSAPLLSRRTAASVGRLVLLGLPLALAAFWLFPRLGAPLWGVPDRALARPGLSEEMRPGEWLDLLNDESPALRVDFDGAVPPTSAMYWRGPVLWHFDGAVWTAPRGLRLIPPAPVGPVAAPRWRYTVAIEPTDRRQLVALDIPLDVPAGASMSVDRVVHAPRPLSALTRWRFESAPVAEFQPDLPSALHALGLQLPDGFNPRTLALGRQWRREAGRNDAAIVQRALAWIRAEFAYTLDAPLVDDRASIDAFLFGYQAGYCEHFAGSFVVLMRAAGIPARVVTGYVGGYRNPIGGYWVVRRSDAHAWVEVWLPGQGWTRVDPTAAVAPERIYDTLADRASTSSGLLDGFGSDAPLRDVGDFLRRGWNDFVLGFDAQRQDRMLQSIGIEQLGAARLGALFAGACALALLVMLWFSARGPREADPLLRAWHRLGARYARLGLDRAPHETATDWARRVARARPEVADALLALTRRFTDARYAPGHTADERAALVRDLRAHRPPRRTR
jgi:transglutaminase-like putative cysteine protease